MVLLYLIAALAFIVLEAFFIYRCAANRKRANLIAGTCTRLLLNAERVAVEQVADRLGRALARGTDPANAARWIERTRPVWSWLALEWRPGRPRHPRRHSFPQRWTYP